jgi:hypothetical protein
MDSKVKKPSVGQKLFIVHKSYWGKGPGLYPDAKVTKVGRKYFKVMMPWGYEVTFRLDNWEEKNDYSSMYYAYGSQKEYEDEIKRKNIIRILEDNIHYGGLSKLSLEQLTSIGKILDIDLDKKLSVI